MIQIICILIPLAAMTLLTPQIRRRMIPKQANRLLWLMFIIYLLGNLYFTLLSRVPESGLHLELQLFRSYGRLFEDAIEEDSAVTGFAALFLKDSSPLVSIILNVMLYYPMGYLLPVLFPKLKPGQIVAIGCACSVATEVVQYIGQMGWCEADDVLHNTLGTAAGVWALQMQGRRKQPTGIGP